MGDTEFYFISSADDEGKVQTVLTDLSFVEIAYLSKVPTHILGEYVNLKKAVDIWTAGKGEKFPIDRDFEAEKQLAVLLQTVEDNGEYDAKEYELV